MRRLVVAGTGVAGNACIRHILKHRHEFSITVFGPSVAGIGVEAADLDPRDDDWLRACGLDLRLGVALVSVDRHAKVALGEDGSRTTFDTLILAAGPANLVLARAAGLEVRGGVVVNDYLQSSDAHVYALGGGIEHRGVVYSGETPIEEQARVLAAHLTGNETAPFRGRATSAASVAALDAFATSGLRLVEQTHSPEDPPVLAGAA